jgi:ERCC4-type nuclease
LARRLFVHFGSLAAMAAAGEDALLNVPGVGRAKAGIIAARLAALMGGEQGHDAG